MEIPFCVQVEIEARAAKEEIFEPKYGGKDHSGYDTLMKYEINPMLSEVFEDGAKWGIEFMIGFVKWAFGDKVNPFMYDEKSGRYLQMFGNSTSWSLDQLIEMYVETYKQR